MDERAIIRSFGIRANLCTRPCSMSGERVKDHAKMKMFTRTMAIVIMGNVRVGTLSFNGIIVYVLPRSLAHVKEITALEQ